MMNCRVRSVFIGSSLSPRSYFFAASVENDIKYCREFTSRRIRNWIERHEHGSLGLRISHAPENAVASVCGIAFDQALGREFRGAFQVHGEMNVWRASRVSHRFDRSEPIFPGRPRFE